MKLILHYLKPFGGSIFFIVILTFIQAIADLSLPSYMGEIVNEGIAKHNTSYILQAGGMMLLISLGGIGCAVTAGYLASRTAIGVGEKLRSKLFVHITGFSLAEFNKFETSSLITRTTNDVQQIQNTSFMMLRMMLRAPLMGIGGIVMAVREDPDLSLILLSLFPVVILIIVLVSRKAMPLFKKIQKELDQLNLVLRESLIGIRIIRAFSRVKYEKRRFGTANNNLTESSIHVNRIMAILNPAMTLCMNLMIISIVWMASFRIDSGKLMVGDMMAFIQYAMQIFMALMMLTMIFIMFPRAFVSAERIKKILATKASIKDGTNTIDKFNQCGCLELKNVTFRYDKAENPAVKKASFTAKAGETVAIIGGTGSGKSTLANLILRYYDIAMGSISIDGIDIKDMKQETLRNKIGFVPQEATLFSGTISENIRFGKQDATDEEVQNACKIAQADEFIESMPDKYNSKVAQGGTNLSGGQKQRLSIARAIVKKPEIFIFDDSFSALDFKTDAALQKALKEVTENSTVLIIAQRITSIRGANRILVMDNGCIVGQGTHEELLKSNSIYQEIVMSQLSQEEIN